MQTIGICQVCGRVDTTYGPFLFPKHKSRNGSTNPHDPLVSCDGQMRPAMKLEMGRYGAAMTAINHIPKHLLSRVKIVPAEYGQWQITEKKVE